MSPVSPPSSSALPDGEQKPVPEQVSHTIETIAELHQASKNARSKHQRSVEAVAESLGRPHTTFVLFGIVATWVAINLALRVTRIAPWDPPPFPLLQAASSVAALLVATVVLTSQNRQRRVMEEWMHLDLQVNLLAEQKIAKLIALVEELRSDLPNVKNREDSLAEAMTQAVDPQAVVSALRGALDEEKDDGGAKAQRR